MSKTSNEVSQFSVAELLRNEDSYLIPMYQRNYAWEEAEITQLIQDIVDYMPEKQPYYIGSLVVFKRDAKGQGMFEAIDGQQRLTTLSLLTSYLHNNKSRHTSWYKGTKLHFESRPNSTRTFEAISEHNFSDSPGEALTADESNTGLLNGYRLIAEKLKLTFKDKESEQDAFEEFLFKQVQVMRIEVPEDTDLNHYFEIMNNRGEQLEKHEVLKAKLMEVLEKCDSDDDKKLSQRTLHLVWEACANMEKYAQSGFSPELRNGLFGHQQWDKLRPNNFEELRSAIGAHTSTEAGKVSMPLSEIIGTPISSDGVSSDKEDSSDRFNSVINFQNFLLHVLKVIVNTESPFQQDGDLDVPLDDKRLIHVFEEYILKKEDAGERAKLFVYGLLKCKHLFDHCIIKREFLQNKDSWSLKNYKWNKGSGGHGSGSYVNSFGSSETEDPVNRSLLMLLSAFHVSTPTMVYKHWLNASLFYLFTQESIQGEQYLKHMEGVAKSFVFDRFLAGDNGSEYYEMIYQRNGACQTNAGDLLKTEITPRLVFGAIENNLVFNYLDYLLWLKSRAESSHKAIQAYEFTFRSSVEHYYPQHPMDGVEKMDELPLNSFGNLCLISHSKNSRLSNFSPEAKRDYYKTNTIDSPKQHLMMAHDGPWNDQTINEHQEEMLEVLLDTLK